mgnify:CR=1 FL=1
MADKIWTGVTDGDYSVSTNWSPSGVPTTSDSVYLTQDYSVDITAGLDQSSVAIANFGGGTTRGLYLKGSAIAFLSLIRGDVGLAHQYGETSTAATIRVKGGTMVCGTGASLTTVDAYGGTTKLGTSVTTLNTYAGNVSTSSTAAITTLNGYGGTITHNGTGTITTANLEGATLDLTNSGLARTVTTLNLRANGTIVYDPSIVIISLQNEADVPVRVSANNA